MIEIIALSLINFILLLRKGVNSSKSDASFGIVYCPNCCKSFNARIKILF